MAKQVLFLCTGNYYRSRFAESVFNFLAQGRGVRWVAASAGLRVQPDGVRNVGPISHYAITALERREIAVERPLRFPRQVTAGELAAAEIVIALKEAEHRPLMEALHPEHASRVVYWNVHDLDVATAEAALPEIEGLVEELLKALG